MADNLNGPLAFSILDEAARAARQGDAAAWRLGSKALGVLGWATPFPRLEASANKEPDDRARRLLARREEARTEKRWTDADALRRELLEAGWSVLDSPAGSRLVPRPA